MDGGGNGDSEDGEPWYSFGTCAVEIYSTLLCCFLHFSNSTPLQTYLSVSVLVIVPNSTRPPDVT